MEWMTSSNPSDGAFPLLRSAAEASAGGPRLPLGLTAAT